MQNKHTRLRLVILFRLLTCLFIYSSCSYKQNQVLFSSDEGNTASMHIDTVPSIYRIQPQDIIQLRNLQNVGALIDNTGTAASTTSAAASTSQTYQVKNDGFVKLPVLGNVKVSGLTIDEAADKVQDMYGKSVLKDPIIELKVISLKITVLGEVKVPGNYSLLSDKTNLVDMIGQAGGLTEKADERHIKIIRGGLQNPQVIMVDLGSLHSLSTPKLVLKSNDIVYVMQNKRAIQNDKVSTISIILQPLLILINTALIIFTLTKK